MSDSTREATKRMADALVLEGIEPTTLLIRERLGRGSNSTITAALKEWREDRGLPDSKGALSGLAPHPALAEMPSTLAEAMSQLWVQAVAEAQLSLAAERRALESEKTAMLEAVRNSQSRLEQTNDRLRYVNDRLLASERLVNELQERYRDEAVIHARETSLLRGQVQELESLVASLREAEQRMQDQLDGQQKDHAEAIEAIREESRRNEAIAYERLDGLRHQLLNDTAHERERMKQEHADLRISFEAREADLNAQHERQVKGLQAELSNARNEAQQRIQVMQQTLGQRDTELGRLQERLDQVEAHQASKQLENDRLLALLERAMQGREEPPQKQQEPDRELIQQVLAAAGDEMYPRIDLVAMVHEETLTDVVEIGRAIDSLIADGMLSEEAGKIGKVMM